MHGCGCEGVWVCEALTDSRPCAVDAWLSTCRHQKANYGLLNLAVLNKCADNSEVSYETCLEAGHMNKLHIKKGPTVLRGKQLVKVRLLGGGARRAGVLRM